MSDEYYGINLFGEKVDVGLAEPEEDDDFSLTPKEKEFNIFALTDAIAARDKRNAWMIYQKALASGMVADEIYWRVMWGVKALLLASKTTAEESGLNPFVYKKAKANLRYWKESELKRMSEDLVVGYHDARRGLGEVETLIEKILLSL